jgi:transcriptional regulator with XRE-family HTH domain
MLRDSATDTLIRIAAGYDQQQAADKLGISREHLSRIENDHANPSDDLWRSIESLYGREAGYPAVREVTTREKVKDVAVKPKKPSKEYPPPYYARVRFIEHECVGRMSAQASAGTSTVRT